MSSSTLCATCSTRLQRFAAALSNTSLCTLERALAGHDQLHGPVLVRHRRSCSSFVTAVLILFHVASTCLVGELAADRAAGEDGAAGVRLQVGQDRGGRRGRAGGVEHAASAASVAKPEAKRRERTIEARGKWTAGDYSRAVRFSQCASAVLAASIAPARSSCAPLKKMLKHHRRHRGQQDPRLEQRVQAVRHLLHPARRHQRDQAEADGQRDDVEVVAVALEVHVREDADAGGRHHAEHHQPRAAEHELRNGFDEGRHLGQHAQHDHDDAAGHARPSGSSRR